MAAHHDETEETNLPEPEGQPYSLLQDVVVVPKSAQKVQTAHGNLKYSSSDIEFYSRQSPDFVNELRGTVTVANGSVRLDLGQICKKITLNCPTGSASSLYVNLMGGTAGNQNGSIQVVAAETRVFTTPVRFIQIASDGAGTAGYRITVEW